MPRYRKNTKKKQKNINKNINNKKKLETNEYQEKNDEDACKLIENVVDLNLNPTNTKELCTETESNSECIENCQLEDVNEEEHKEDDKEEIGLQIEEVISDSVKMTENNPIILKEFEIIDETELQNTDVVNVINESNNDNNYTVSNEQVDVTNETINNDTNSQQISLTNIESSDCMDGKTSLDNQPHVSMIDDESVNSTNIDCKKTPNLDYKNRRESKRAAIENHFLPKFINPIYLDSIKEENCEINEKDNRKNELPELNDIATQYISNNNLILEEIEPYFSEIESNNVAFETIIEEVNSESLSPKSDKSINLNPIPETNIIDDTNKNYIHIISTTLYHPTQNENLTTNMPSHTNPNENKYNIEKCIYPEPPATNEKPQSNLQMNCEIVSQKILNIEEEVNADKSKQNSNKSNIQYNKIKDINNFFAKVENNENHDINLNKIILEIEKPCVTEMSSLAENKIEHNNIKKKEYLDISCSEEILTNQSIVKNIINLSDDQQSDISNDQNNSLNSPIKPLRLMCTETLASMPYGEDVLEELASVATSLSHLTQQHQGSNCLENQNNHNTSDSQSEYPISNKNTLADIGCLDDDNMLQSSFSSKITENKICPTKNNTELLNCRSSSEYSSTKSLKNILDTTPKITKDIEDFNELRRPQLKETITSSKNLLPNLDDSENRLLNKNLFYDNNLKNNYNFLESVQDPLKQSYDENLLKKINANVNEFNDLKKELSKSILNNEKNLKNNERIINIEVMNKPFCGQLMQTATKTYSDKDILTNDVKKDMENNNDFSWSTYNKSFESSKDENTSNKNNLEEKFNKIMSDFKLDTKSSESMPKTPPRKEYNQIFINRNINDNTNSQINTNINKDISYDEFRKRAKEKATQRAKSEYFEREHFFKDFNRFSELYDDDFFNKNITNANNVKNHKIVNIPIKLEENNRKSMPEVKLKSPLQNIQINQTESTHKIRHIPINIEKLDSTESALKNEFIKSDNLIGKSVKTPYDYVKQLPDNNKINEFDMRIWPRHGKIRAPRLSSSTTNLMSSESDIFKDFNSYRSCSRKKEHSSCQSLIDETPISNFCTQKLSMPTLLHMDWNEKHINDSQTDFNKLENERSKLIEEMNKVHEKRRTLNKEFQSNHLKRRSEEEIFRQEMQNEWLNKIAEQEERRLHKTIKISKIITDNSSETSSRDNKKLNITDEFLKRVEERRSKLCMPSDSDWESGAESQPVPSNNETDNKEDSEAKIKVIDGQKEKDLKNLPKHLVEFAEFVQKFEEEHLKESKELKDDFWSVDQKTEEESFEKQPPTPPPPPLWSPKPSPTSERKEFRPVKFESPTLPRRYVQINSAPVAPPPWSYTDHHHKQENKFDSPITKPTEKLKKQGAYIETEQNHHLNQDFNSFEPNDFSNSIKNEYMTVIESENDGSQNMAQLNRKKLDGVGPTTKDGIPISLRSEVDQNNQHKWYKTMFNTLHKVHDGDESVIIRYKSPRGRYLYKSKGYMSEPETNDSNYTTMKYTNKLGKRTTSTGGNADDVQIYGTMPNLSKYGSRRHPGKIEDFTPGQSSASEKKRSHQQWEQQKLSPSYTEGNLSRVLKEQGYESESNVIFRKRVECQSNPLSPVEQKQVYLNVQSGGEPPLNGFRKPAPEKPKEDKDFQYVPLPSELKKHRHNNKVCHEKERNHYSTHRTINTQNTVSFIPITKFLIQPPPPPNRSSSRTRTSDTFKNCFNVKKSTPSSERHRRCFDTDLFTKSPDKFKTVSLRKNKYFDTIFRSQSGGAVNKIDSKIEKTDSFQFNESNKQYDRLGSASPLIKSASRFTKRPQSLSPIAFGRSLSKERAFAVEKKRLEQSLPLCKKSFTASTNILRDPSLKSPNEVKKAVQSFAHIHPTTKNKSLQKKHSPTCAELNCSHNLTSTRKKYNGVNNRKDSKLLKFSYSLVSRGIDIQNMSPKNNTTVHRKMTTGLKMQPYNNKTNSTISLTRTNSTFSVNSNESKTKQTMENSNTYPKPKKLLKSKSQSNAGINSLMICPRKKDINQSKNISNGVRKYQECNDKSNAEMLNPQESIRSNNFFQNLFLRDMLPSLHSHEESDSRMGSNFREKSQFWSKFSTKSEPSLQQSNLYLSEKESLPNAKFISCHIQTCHESRNPQPFHSENPSSDEECHSKYFNNFGHRSLSEPRSHINLSDHSSPNNVVQTISHSLDKNYRQLSPTRGSPYTDGFNVNKRFSPTREVRVPIKEIQLFSPKLDVGELQNQKQYFSPTLSEAIRPYSSISSQKKLAKSFSPTREIRISQDSNHCYCPYLYNSKSSPSLSPTRKVIISNQSQCDENHGILVKSYDTEFNKKPRSKSFSPTREIRICPDKKSIQNSLFPSTRHAISPTLEATCEVKNKKNKGQSSTRAKEMIDLRSPSHRRIQSFRENRKSDTKTLIRASSLSSADDRQKQNIANIPQTYSKENKKHSNKFLDLNNFYSNIERFGQLEHATSTTDLRAIRKQGQTVDYDEWKKIRAHKRAEKELNYVLRAIKQDEREKDFLFRPKELEDIKWTESSDCGLRCKEKSVEDLRENFEKTLKYEIPDKTKILESYSNKDIYKPHWRAMTVADLATNLQAKFNPEKKIIGTEKMQQQNDRNLGFSKKIISTLSKEQIHKIKDQLNEIYSSPLIEETYKYSTKTETPSQQIKKIDSNTISKDDLLNKDLKKKKDDIITYNSHTQNIISKRDDRKVYNSKSCDRIPTKYVRKEHELNETEKKKISKSLSQEIQTKGLELRKSKSNHMVPTNQESKGAINKPRQTLQRNVPILPSSSDIVKDTEKENVNKKIKYFEEIKTEIPPKTIYHAREYSSPDEEEVLSKIDKKIKAKESQEERYNLSNYKQLSSSASDLKELFGEKESIRTNYLGCEENKPSDLILNYTSYLDNNNSFIHSDYNYGITQSFDNVYRSRSMSPIRERTYKKIWDNINTGSVKKIKNKFENINNNLKGRNDNSYCLRKINSDPELNKQKKKDSNKTTVKAYENSDVSCIAYKFEKIPSRGRPRYRKNLSPIPRVQIKKSDLMMPHIDIISKTASLKQKLGKNELTNSNYPKSLRSGNVDRIRCKFDHCSVLSQIYTSSPDISELKDISSYLRGEWIAHKFPNKIDNNKTSISLEEEPNCRKEESKVYRRPSSTSPLTNKTIVTSILKPYYNSFGHRTFQSLVQSPKSCYGVNHNQNQQHSTGVTFEENDIVPSAPAPPPKGVTFTDNGKNSESYYRYFENIVNKSPIRYECKDIIQDEELAHQQRESLAKIYQKEREKKHIQELKNMNNRRHADNFIPSQKLQIPLNRFDDFNADLPEPKKIPKTLVKALYNFTGESDRELSFKKGDVMYIKRLVDTNWYEGEHNGRVGLLPANYIQIISKNGTQSQQKRVSEGQGRAKYNFQAQSAFELSLNKGELVTLIRQVDENWFEGKIANRKGIFPVSYVEILTDIGAEDLNKPFRSPTVQNYQPSLDILRTNLNHEFNTLTNGHPANEILKETKTQILHVDTDSQPIAFRALYKYRPQNNDELELQESDIIYVLEMCDDGWYVGTSQRTGCFGTFPGNYVERV